MLIKQSRKEQRLVEEEEEERSPVVEGGKSCSKEKILFICIVLQSKMVFSC